MVTVSPHGSGKAVCDLPIAYGQDVRVDIQGRPAAVIAQPLLHDIRRHAVTEQDRGVRMA